MPSIKTGCSASLLKTSFVAGSILALLTAHTHAGWFSSEKYDCENASVIEDVKNQIACEQLLKCPAIGFANLAAVVSAGSTKIIAKLDEYRITQTEIGISKMTKPTDVDIRFTQAFWQKVSEDLKAVALSLPNAFLDIRNFTDDFNPNVSKYSCRLTFRYSPEIYIPWWDFNIRAQLSKDNLTLVASNEEMKKNPNSDYLSMVTNMALQANGIAEKAKDPTIQTASFTVQPSSGKGFLVELRNVPIPGQ